jgi:hypothetical protein
VTSTANQDNPLMDDELSMTETEKAEFPDPFSSWEDEDGESLHLHDSLHQS